MKYLLSILLALAPACAEAPSGVDVIIDGVREPHLAAAHAHLAAKLDPSRPVVLRTAPLLVWGLLGQTRMYADRYEITIDESLTEWAQQMVLIHEWAHVESWEDGIHDDPRYDPHGDEWGERYSRVFQAWVGED